ncbi:MAG: DNA polymerase IV [Planctomycetes bacterium]|nr:DNA polymerase IV [Planctomycetota bacterium]
MTPRSILHLDMDAFFAAIEVLDHPALAGRPVIVGGTPEGHGVVSTASYEARRFGVRSAMPAATARRLCPDGVFLSPRHDRYAAVSRTVFDCLRQESPLVEPVSIDEAFVDLTGTERRAGDAVDAARRIKARIRQETGLACSAGVASNKLVAKIASDLRKPDGLVAVRAGGEAAFLAPLELRRLWGIGPKTGERLARAGWRTIGDIQAAGEERLARILGREAARWLHPLALGIDDRPVVAEAGDPKSIGHETTFASFLSDPEAIETALLDLAEEVGRRLRGEGMKARTVTLKVRDETFRTRTRARTLAEPTDIGLEIFRAARDLLRQRVALGGHRVRLLGVTASRLEGGSWMQLALLPDGRERQADLARAVDRIKDRLGEGAIRPARLLPAGDDRHAAAGNPDERRPRRRGRTT